MVVWCCNQTSHGLDGYILLLNATEGILSMRVSDTDQVQ